MSWDRAPWFRSLLLPLAALVVGVAIVVGLVLGGAVQGDKTYGTQVQEPTTRPTVLIGP